MKITPYHSKKICHTVLSLQVMADRIQARSCDAADDKDAEVMRDAAFFLTEMAVKHAYPEAQSLIEDLHD